MYQSLMCRGLAWDGPCNRGLGGFAQRALSNEICLEDSTWGAEPGTDRCPGFSPFWDATLSTHEIDLKLRRYLAKTLENEFPIAM